LTTPAAKDRLKSVEMMTSTTTDMTAIDAGDVMDHADHS
jgi:hypothetical protein